MKSIFEEMGGTYTLGADGMYYPDLELPADEEPYAQRLYQRTSSLALHGAFDGRQAGVPPECH